MQDKKIIASRLAALLSVALKPTFFARLPIMAALTLGLANVSTAEVFFQEDFERGTVTSNPNPQWSLNAPMSANNIDRAMMFGQNDIYTVSNTVAHSGKYSFRLDFAGRNNWCNQCGTKEIKVSQADLNSGCATISGGPWGKVIYNKTNGFSSWNVTANSKSKVCFETSKAQGSSLLSSSELSSGAALKVPYQCGVNGTVGGSKGRRSDCNKAINYLNGASSDDFGFGKTLSRRFYLYIPSATKLPDTTLKLGYVHFKKNGGVASNKLKLSVQRGLTLELNAPGGNVTNKYAIKKDTWHYFEEVFTRESSDSASNGSYKLYVGAVERGDNLSKPVVTQSNIKLGSLVDMSINGNFQHFSDASGYVYFDDFLISDRYVGPTGSGDKSSPAPDPKEENPPTPPKLSAR